MELQTVLENIGLGEKEAKVYLALLGMGEITAAKLAEKTGLDRTLMYQITNRLIEEGIVSYIVKNNVRYFSAADPETLLKKLQEKEQQLEQILPELKARQKLFRPETKVELYRGREGINTILKMIIRDRQPYHILGGAHEATIVFELENTIFVKHAEKARLPGKIIARKGDSFFIGKDEEFRYVPEHLISSTSMIMWGTKTAVFVWSEPYYALLIESEEIAKNNLAMFHHMWGIAERPSDADVKKRLLK